jgi:hypothetical protein
LIGLQAGWYACRLTGLQVDRLAGRFVGLQACRLTGLLAILLVSPEATHLPLKCKTPFLIFLKSVLYIFAPFLYEKINSS